MGEQRAAMMFTDPSYNVPAIADTAPDVSFAPERLAA